MEFGVFTTKLENIFTNQDESKEKEGSRERVDGNKEKIYKLIIKSLPQSEDARFSYFVFF